MNKFLLTGLLGLAFAACSDSDNTDNPTVTGENTYVKLTLNVAGANTRLSQDLTPLAAEKEVTDATIYIFNSVGTFEKAVTLASGATTTDAFEITTGAKTIHALVNQSATAPTVTVGTPLATFKAETASYSWTSTNATVGGSAATNSSGFWMSTLDDTNTITLVSATEAEVNSGTNNVEITVGRSVAKVGVLFDETTVTQPVGVGELTNVTYAMFNNPVSLFAIPSKINGYTNTPYYDKGYYTGDGHNAYYPASYGTATGGTADAGNYQAPTWTTSNANSNADFEYPSYISENSNETATRGNATLAILKGTFTPEEVYAQSTSNADYVEVDNTWNGGTFYRIFSAKENACVGAFLVFDYTTATPATSTDALLENILGTDLYDSSDIYTCREYTNGVAYYGIWLKNESASGDVNKYTVNRNQYWAVNITNVTGCGADCEENVIKDGKDKEGEPNTPETPLPETTFIKATIKVASWSEVQQSGGI